MQKEALRYLHNARDLLKQVPIEDDIYLDRKPVREALGTAYLAVLEAINQGLLKRGVPERALPQSVDGYRRALQKYLAIHNGRLLREFNNLYDTLHTAGYYRGLLYNANIVKDALKAARMFVEKVG
ncbi:MAG: DUF5618 family protein [Nitrospirota bacterium]